MNIVIIGATGGIGSALIDRFSSDTSNQVFALGRRRPRIVRENIDYLPIDFDEEPSLETAARFCTAEAPVDVVVNTVGVLHGDGLYPEKSIREVSDTALGTYFHTNTICSALALKHFLWTLPRQRRGVYASLSARVGSIEDNRLGGWYGYRASKAAHNMLIKTVAIEFKRTHRHGLIIGIHPGTVDTKLSEPFTGDLPEERVFTPDYAARQIMMLMERVRPEQSGEILAYDGTRIPG